MDYRSNHLQHFLCEGGKLIHSHRIYPFRAVYEHLKPSTHETDSPVQFAEFAEFSRSVVSDSL